MLAGLNSVTDSDPQMAQFDAARPVHIAFWSLHILVAITLLCACPEMWYFSAISFFSCVNLLLARLIVRRYARPGRARVLFGRGLCFSTALMCILSHVGVEHVGLGEPANETEVWMFAVLTMTVPVFMRFAGIDETHRLINSCFIGFVVTLTPSWAVMPHNKTTLLMWMALFAGEMAGAHLSTLLFRVSVALREASRNAVTYPTQPEPVNAAPCTAPLKVASEESLQEVNAEGHRGHAISQRLAGTAAAEAVDPEEMCADDLLKWFIQQTEIDFRGVRILPLTLAFDDSRMELLYIVSTFPRLHSTHCYHCFAAICICALSIHYCPATLPMGVVVIPYACVLWLARLRVRAYTSVPRAVSELGAWQTFSALLAGACFCFNAVRNASCRSAQSSPELASCHAAILKFGHAEGQPEEARLGVGMNSVGIVCVALLLMLSGAYHRVSVVAHNATVTSRTTIILCVAVGYTDLQHGLLLPGALEKTLLAFMVMMIGELIGASITVMRRSLFREWIINAREAASVAAAANARVAAAEENALQLGRVNKQREAELAADKRLNHVVKGRCGSAINSIDSFRLLLQPYLRQPLPPDLEGMLTAPLTHLAEAVEWCHRRQVGRADGH
jgi:predicted small integral membrane protein